MGAWGKNKYRVFGDSQMGQNGTLKCLMRDYYRDTDPLHRVFFGKIKLFFARGKNTSLVNFVHPELDLNLIEMSVKFNLVDHQDYFYGIGATVRAEKREQLCSLAGGRFAYDMVQQANFLEEKHLRSDDFSYDIDYVIKSFDHNGYNLYAFKLAYSQNYFNGGQCLFNFSLSQVTKEYGVQHLSQIDDEVLRVIRQQLRGRLGYDFRGEFDLHLCRFEDETMGLQLSVEHKYIPRFRHCFSACTLERLFPLSLPLEFEKASEAVNLHSI